MILPGRAGRAAKRASGLATAASLLRVPAGSLVLAVEASLLRALEGSLLLVPDGLWLLDPEASLLGIVSEIVYDPRHVDKGAGRARVLARVVTHT